jgi:hypothetical protein
MNLTKTLRKQGYDLISGPIRNHQLLQLWLKTPFNDVELYYAHLDHAFTSTVALKSIENPSLQIDATIKDTYGFNIGMSLLQELLNSLGLGAFELSLEVASGKKISISYKGAVTREVPIGELENYFSNADFKHPNKALLRNANRDQLLLITGVLFAKNLVVDIETDVAIDPDLIVKLTDLVAGELNFSKQGSHSLQMVSSGKSFFPIAVKASRVYFDKGHFEKTYLISDNRLFF